MDKAPEFDRYADTYDLELNRALRASGEDKQYFAAARVKWLGRCLSELEERPTTAIDYGCGLGDTTPLLRAHLDLQLALGLDISPRLLESALRSHRSSTCHFMRFEEHCPAEDIDLVYCNGVFHHIPIPERSRAFAYVNRCLRVGGLFSFWENNPWNPGTRFIMSRCSFDANAVMIPAREARQLAQSHGFQVLRLDFLFFFPKFLKVFRSSEPLLRKFPMGAQYQMLCRKLAK